MAGLPGTDGASCGGRVRCCGPLGVPQATTGCPQADCVLRGGEVMVGVGSMGCLLSSLWNGTWSFLNMPSSGTLGWFLFAVSLVTHGTHFLGLKNRRKKACR